MSTLLEWFDRYTGPKALNRAPGQWKCLLGGLCPVTRGYGETPEDAIEACRSAAKKRRDTFAEIDRQDAEAEVTAPALHLEGWER